MPITRPRPRAELQRFRSGLALAAGKTTDTSASLLVESRQPVDQRAATYAMPSAAVATRSALQAPGGVPSEASAPRTIAISTRVMQCVGDAAAGLVLSQLIYWSRRSADDGAREGWIWKTSDDWSTELGGMSWKVQHRARRHLLDLGFIEERRLTMPARLEYRLLLTPLLEALTEGTGLNADAGTWLDATMVEPLFGRGFAWHTSLSRLLPLHTAMLCSRLLAGVRWPPAQTASGFDGDVQPALRYVGLSRAGWLRETGLSRDQWQTARRNLLRIGVLVERQRNFPRRVDLALRLHDLAAVLRASVATEPYRQDRAILLGGIGRLPLQPSQSPNPTFKALPKLPAENARSSPQLLQLQLNQLLPQLGAAVQAPAMACPIPAFGWGGGGGYERAIKTEDSQPARQPTESLSDAPPSSPRLHWPACFTKGDQARARQQLKDLATTDQQLLLDEIAWMQSTGKSIRSPVALLRTLVMRHANGSFSPDGAHRIAEAREQVRGTAQDRSQPAQPTSNGPSPEVKARLLALGSGGRRSA